MVVHNVTFPEEWCEGSVGGPAFRTILQTVSGGRRAAVATQGYPAYRYQIQLSARAFAEASSVANFIVQRQGALYGFRLKDSLDYTSAADGRDTPSLANSQIIGVGNGTATVFQLKKTYTDSANSVERPITLPVSGSVTAYQDDVLVNSSLYSVDTMTGRVTFNTAPGLGVVVRAAFQFHVPVAFGQDVDEWYQQRASRVTVDIPRITMDEIPQHVSTWDRPWPGGGTSFLSASVTGATSVSLANGVVQPYLNTTGSAQNLNLPAVAGIATGPGIFVLTNSSSSDANLVVRDTDRAITVTTLTPGDTAQIALVRNAADEKRWLPYA